VSWVGGLGGEILIYRGHKLELSDCCVSIQIPGLPVDLPIFLGVGGGGGD